MSLRYQLFLSRRLVTSTGIKDGAVLVDYAGIIEDILTREEAETFMARYPSEVKVIDAGDLVIMAGVVDSHVHINEPGRTAWEGFRTATMAAAAGGITTVVDMPLNSIPPTTTVPNLKTKAMAAKGNVFVDVGFWGGVIPGNEKDLRDLIQAGIVGFKCFLCPSGVEEFPHVEAEDLKKAIKVLEETDSVLAFHAEVDCDNSSSNNTSGKDPEVYNTFLETRPGIMEVKAVSLITELIKTSDVRVHVVHVSSADVVPLLKQARELRAARGVAAWRAGVTAETCHHYLTLDADGIPPGHSEYKCCPPIRDLQNQERLWNYVKEGQLDLVVSDHSPCTPDLKCANNLKSWGGISSVQFGLSLFWTAASARGFSLPQVSRYLSEGPAKLCGFYGRKGALQPGFDADLIFFDPDATFTVTPDIILHKNKLTPYLVKTLRGVVKKTFLRGTLIFSDDEILNEPRGKLLLNRFE